MHTLAKLWTWIGQTFIPAAIAWAVYVRGGMTGERFEEGVLISRGYWGLLVALVVGILLATVGGLYVREAKRTAAKIVVPPNTMFEEAATNSLISWATAVIFSMAVLAAVTLFGERYADSRIYSWNGISPLASGFWSSRLAAHESGCTHGPCYAIAQRFRAGQA